MIKALLFIQKLQFKFFRIYNCLLIRTLLFNNIMKNTLILICNILLCSQKKKFKNNQFKIRDKLSVKKVTGVDLNCKL
jgi:hypothetical protein